MENNSSGVFFLWQVWGCVLLFTSVFWWGKPVSRLQKMRQLPKAEPARGAWMSLATLSAFPEHRGALGGFSHLPPPHLEPWVCTGRQLQPPQVLLRWSGAGPYKKFLLAPPRSWQFLWDFSWISLSYPWGTKTGCCCISQLNNCLPLGRELSNPSLLSRIITPLKMEYPGTGTSGTSVGVWTHTGKDKAEERKMYGKVLLLIAPAPPCCKKICLERCSSSRWLHQNMNGGCRIFVVPFVNGLLPSGCGLLSLACSAHKQKVVPS